MLDIKEGDLLVVGGKDYPIRSVSEWAMARASYSSFAKQATVSASTKRSPAVVDGKRGVPTTNLVNLYCTPLDPVDPDVIRRLGLDTPYELKQTFVDSTTGFCHLIVEELKL